jgi:hypothetical protein
MVRSWQDSERSGNQRRNGLGRGSETWRVFSAAAQLSDSMPKYADTDFRVTLKTLEYPNKASSVSYRGEEDSSGGPSRSPFDSQVCFLCGTHDIRNPLNLDFASIFAFAE